MFGFHHTVHELTFYYLGYFYGLLSKNDMFRIKMIRLHNSKVSCHCLGMKITVTVVILQFYSL